jgi:hypothetical protein
MAVDIKELAKKGREDPVWWVENVVGNRLWSKQREIIESVRDNKLTTVRSCNGAGKSFVSANIVAWFLTNHPESIVITTAPTTRQVEEILWQEIARIYAKSKFPLGGRLLKTKWDFGAKWFALGLSTNEPDKFQGFHAPHILGVIDEACGVDSVIYEAMSSVLTSEGARMLLIGNPTEPEGEFYRSFSSPLYHKIHISAFDTPNFTNEFGYRVPGLSTPEWVEERKLEWGEDSPAYYARVLGEFPDISSSTMIPLSWIIKATMLDLKVQEKPRTIGVDVARYGDDSTVIAKRSGNELEGYRILNKIDTVEVANEVARDFDEFPGCELIAVDAVGIGAGVADILRQKGYPAIDIQSGEKAYQSTRFNNKRTEMWFRLRELLRTQSIKLPNDDKMIGELSSPKYSFDTAGRYVLETKDEMKKRGLRSPNIADAVVYAFAYDGKYHSYILQEQSRLQKINKDTVNYLLKQLEKEAREADIWSY